ncbi:OB-fold nucleic acid binding domain containing protein, partial [Reticulomyxa filosa]
MSEKSEAGSSTYATLTTIDQFETKTLPKFIKIKDLTPKSCGFSLYGKMIFSRIILDRLNIDGTRKRVAEMFVVVVFFFLKNALHYTGCVMVTLENEQIAEVKIGDVLIVRNGHVHMLPQGFLRIGINKWGRIDTVSGNCMPGQINYQCNKSDVEYILTSPTELPTATSNLSDEKVPKDKRNENEHVIRKLHPYEEKLSSSNIVTCIVLSGKLTKDDVINAYRLARIEHPYLR